MMAVNIVEAFKRRRMKGRRIQLVLLCGWSLEQGCSANWINHFWSTRMTTHWSHRKSSIQLHQCHSQTSLSTTIAIVEYSLTNPSNTVHFGRWYHESYPSFSSPSTPPFRKIKTSTHISHSVPIQDLGHSLTELQAKMTARSQFALEWACDCVRYRRKSKAPSDCTLRTANLSHFLMALYDDVDCTVFLREEG